MTHENEEGRAGHTPNFETSLAREVNPIVAATTHIFNLASPYLDKNQLKRVEQGSQKTLIEERRASK